MKAKGVIVSVMAMGFVQSQGLSPSYAQDVFEPYVVGGQQSLSLVISARGRNKKEAQRRFMRSRREKERFCESIGRLEPVGPIREEKDSSSGIVTLTQTTKCVFEEPGPTKEW